MAYLFFSDRISSFVIVIKLLVLLFHWLFRFLDCYFSVFPFWKKLFRVPRFRVNWTSKSAKLLGLRTFPKLPVITCHTYRMTLCFSCSFVTDQKHRWAKLFLFQSLKINYCHAYRMMLRFRRSFLTDKKDRPARLFLFQSLKVIN